MNRSGRSDLFCKWRFAQLIAQKKLALTQGDLCDPDSVWVTAGYKHARVGARTILGIGTMLPFAMQTETASPCYSPNFACTARRISANATGFTR